MQRRPKRRQVAAQRAADIQKKSAPQTAEIGICLENLCHENKGYSVKGISLEGDGTVSGTLLSLTFFAFMPDFLQIVLIFAYTE